MLKLKTISKGAVAMITGALLTLCLLVNHVMALGDDPTSAPAGSVLKGEMDSGAYKYWLVAIAFVASFFAFAWLLGFFKRRRSLALTFLAGAGLAICSMANKALALGADPSAAPDGATLKTELDGNAYKYWLVAIAFVASFFAFAWLLGFFKRRRSL